MSTEAPQVSVLLSTYNGETYLPELLTSLARQTHGALRLEVRDDGSSDGTLDVLERFGATRPLHRLVRGQRLGFVRSFFELLATADEDSDYFAFCDQDDVWLPEKIERAVTALRRDADSRPSLYASRFLYVDPHGRSLGESHRPGRLGLGNALVENVALGCTIVIDRAARRLLLEALPDLDRLAVHDWWSYLVVSTCGRFVFDDAVTLHYRQHGGNASGAHPSALRTLFRRVAAVVTRRAKPFPHRFQALELRRCFGTRLGPADRYLLDYFIEGCSGAWPRLVLALSPRIWRHSTLASCTSRLKIAAGLV